MSSAEPTHARHLRTLMGDAIYNSGEWMPYPNPQDIVSAQFRQGCAELEVHYKTHSDDRDSLDTIIIDAAPILTAMLTHAIGAVEI